jgi:heme/copper-type cytochrome/quinol oxidase subunit 2
MLKKAFCKCSCHFFVSFTTNVTSILFKKIINFLTEAQNTATTPHHKKDIAIIVVVVVVVVVVVIIIIIIIIISSSSSSSSTQYLWLMHSHVPTHTISTELPPARQNKSAWLLFHIRPHTASV